MYLENPLYIWLKGQPFQPLCFWSPLTAENGKTTDPEELNNMAKVSNVSGQPIVF